MSLERVLGNPSARRGQTWRPSISVSPPPLMTGAAGGARVKRSCSDWHNNCGGETEMPAGVDSGNETTSSLSLVYRTFAKTFV